MENCQTFPGGRSTGELSLVGALDYETATSHQVVIEVSDQGTPTAKTATVAVTIVVNPVNEDDPVFTPSASYGPIDVDEDESTGEAVRRRVDWVMMMRGSKRGREREGGRERERESEREGKKEKERGRDRDIDIETGRERERDRQTERQRQMNEERRQSEIKKEGCKEENKNWKGCAGGRETI